MHRLFHLFLIALLCLSVLSLSTSKKQTLVQSNSESLVSKFCLEITNYTSRSNISCNRTRTVREKFSLRQMLRDSALRNLRKSPRKQLTQQLPLLMQLPPLLQPLKNDFVCPLLKGGTFQLFK